MIERELRGMDTNIIVKLCGACIATKKMLTLFYVIFSVYCFLNDSLESAITTVGLLGVGCLLIVLYLYFFEKKMKKELVDRDYDISSLNSRTKSFQKKFLIFLICAAIIFGITIFGVIHFSTKDPTANNISQCKSCGREFSHSDDRTSISKSGMCSNCLGNYKSMSEFIKDNT